MYSRELLKMGREDARNMYSSILTLLGSGHQKPA